MYGNLGIPMKIEIQSDSSTANSLRNRLQDSERSTFARVTSGYKKESKTETSVLEGAYSEEPARMLEQNQSLLQYYNNFASLQDWYSTDHGSHTPLQDEGDCRSCTHTRRTEIKSTEIDGCQR